MDVLIYFIYSFESIFYLLLFGQNRKESDPSFKQRLAFGARLDGLKLGKAGLFRQLEPSTVRMPAWGCGVQFENLPPFSGQLFPVGSGPPLSALKQISVSSYSPDAFKSSTTRPIAASIQLLQW